MPSATPDTLPARPEPPRQIAATGPALPPGRGELSDAVIRALSGPPGGARLLPERSAGAPDPVQAADPYGDDLQLALYLCYELHYASFAQVSGDWEWDPELLRLRAALEGRFLGALREDATRHTAVADAMAGLLVEPVDGDGVSHFLASERGELWQVREYAAQRSLYHLKEADPHAWVIPRLRGQAKAAMVAVEFDEFGAGRGDRVHAELFAALLADLGLDPAYGAHLDAAPAPMLTLVNLMSLFGLHRTLRGALVGHFAAVEITSSPASRRLAQAMERLDAGEAAAHFYREHVEADAVHEQIVRRDVVADLLRQEPGLEADVAFGMDATEFTEQALADHLLTCWRAGRSSLRVPLR
ncbi:iron-containing redox enzyme family protein [Streptomyces sp. 549]|uniref:iron-containing redox enzyme family protein n=1 Tax=Streptomyces sp. 549 TaxID=3049076 RepID=UPI0024C27627|nr:iron-containing redox enzyme family protein [Streptomyces sp. 549]MDK1471954.1 iron-containing redox enzyme family protein [Streptomyces sp. 549]